MGINDWLLILNLVRLVLEKPGRKMGARRGRGARSLLGGETRCGHVSFFARRKRSTEGRGDEKGLGGGVF